MLRIEEENEKTYGHALAEALFPLFKSDKEYDLIKAVIAERFPGDKMNIFIMYKYLASRHLPKFVLFSHRLPYGIVIKRLVPEKAWNEYYCNKILSKIHPFDFDVQYHESLGCISERYLPGFDVTELPKYMFEEKKFIRLIFYWAGKCACVGYIFGLGDRGHNERIQCNESKDLFQFIAYTDRFEPIINIDFEEFPSKRVFSLEIDATEVALLFYSIFLQLPQNSKQSDLNKMFNSYYSGFLTKYREVTYLWEKNKKYIHENLRKLFQIAPRKDSQKSISILNKRATEFLETNVFYKAFEMIEKEITKKNQKLGMNYANILRKKRELLHSQR